MKLLKYIFLFIIVSTFSEGFSQKQASTKPKLVVGIVIDQMAFNNLYKYQSRYGEGGFNRLINEGFNFKKFETAWVAFEKSRT